MKVCSYSNKIISSFYTQLYCSVFSFLMIRNNLAEIGFITFHNGYFLV